jgi:hypothetical protein
MISEHIGNTMQWNMDLLDRFIAPDISKFTSATIPDLSPEFPEARHWLGNHFLNNFVEGSFKDRARQITVGYLRRVYHAFVTYHNARETTLRYLSGNQPDNPRIQQYYESIALWEWFILQAAMALDLYKWLNSGTGAFSKNDGSSTFGLYTIANQIKHLSGCVDSGQCGPNESVPLWLSNAGLQSFNISLLYTEAAEELRALAELADQLQDPKAFVASRAHATVP